MTDEMITDHVRQNLSRVLFALLAFLGASATAFVVDVALPYKVVTAALGVIAIVTAMPLLTASDEQRSVATRWRSGLVGGSLTLAVGVLAAGWLLRPPTVDPGIPATLILLDSSSVMQEQFDDGMTKLDAAREAISKRLKDFSLDQHGLATYGVDACDGDPLTEHVAIARDQAEAVKGATTGLTASGMSNPFTAGTLASALLNEFTGQRHVLVVAGGLDDECGGDIRDMRREARQRDVDVTWDLVGLGFSSEDKQAATDLNDVDVHLADTIDELDATMEQLLFERSIRNGLDFLESFMVQAREPLNDAVDAEHAGDFDAADQHLATAAEQAARANTRFDELVLEDVGQELQRVQQLAREQLRRLDASIPLLQEVVRLDREMGEEPTDEQLETRNEAVDAYNEVIDAYNDALDALSNEVDNVLNEMFSLPR